MYNSRILKLQERLVKDGLEAYVIKSSDPHLSEMIAPKYKAVREYYCPFTGSNATLLITRDSAYLYTDGRYWIQAADEIKDTFIMLVEDGKDGVDNIYDFVEKNNLYPLGIDLSLISNKELSKFTKGKANRVFGVDYSFLVADRPALSNNKIWKVDDNLLSDTLEERAERIINEVVKEGGDAIIISALDDIAYVLGYRGDDIPYTPVFYSYLYIDTDGNIDLFVDLNKIPDDFTPRVNLHPYDDIYFFIEEKKDRIFSLDEDKTNAKIINKIKHKIYQVCPAFKNKAIKGKVEIQKSKIVQAYDGIKYVKLQKYIDDNIESNQLDEYKIGQYIDSLRKRDPRCFSLSFETIVGIDANSAMMHYAPKEIGSKRLTSKSQVVLVDSGGHYYGGTTDITRTFIVNKEPLKEVIRDYTLTLKSHISLSKAIFEKGCTGQSLDYAARSVMWERGLDYKCGTGHGVGYMLCVHEGPINFRFTTPINGKPEVLLPGHIITDEPGVYREGRYGIRLENELLVRDAFVIDSEAKRKAIQGTFFAFEPITYVPFDKRGIDVTMLSNEEINWINRYHAHVCSTLLPLCGSDDSLKEYLINITSPLFK